MSKEVKSRELNITFDTKNQTVSITTNGSIDNLTELPLGLIAQKLRDRCIDSGISNADWPFVERGLERDWELKITRV